MYMLWRLLLPHHKRRSSRAHRTAVPDIVVHGGGSLVSSREVGRGPSPSAAAERRRVCHVERRREYLSVWSHGGRVSLLEGGAVLCRALWEEEGGVGGGEVSEMLQRVGRRGRDG